MILGHVLRGQILYTNDIVLPDNLGGQFVQHVLPLVCNMLMEPCHLKPCFLPAVAPLCFSGELPLETGQSLLGLSLIHI